jgi:phage terminase large subunit
VLKDEIKIHVGKNELIVADCAENRLIFDLQSDFNIKPVKKTGTVAQWLRLMQDYEMIITERSHNLAKEFSNYSWSDERAGIPIDAFNHGIDSGRYCYMELYSTGQGAIIGMRSF